MRLAVQLTYLQDKHFLAGICRQPVGQHTPSSATTNDNVVILVASCPDSNCAPSTLTCTNSCSVELVD
jgi:hypothetical protein